MPDRRRKPERINKTDKGKGGGGRNLKTRSRVRPRKTHRDRESEGEREMPGVSNNNLYKHTLIIHVPYRCWRENPKFTEHN